MFPATAALVVSLLAQPGGTLDSRTCFALLERQAAQLRDVTFIYEGSITSYPPKPGAEAKESRFQGFYARRSDGAGLVDLYTLGSGGKPDSRELYGVLHDQFSMLDASPDALPPLRARDPQVAPGGPSSLGFPRSAERVYLAWLSVRFDQRYQPDEYEFQNLGREVIDGNTCDVVKMLGQPRPLLKRWAGPIPYFKLWMDLGRGGLIVRMDTLEGDQLVYRTSIEKHHEVKLPGGGSVFLPATALVTVYAEAFLKLGKSVFRDSPTAEEHYRILRDTIKVDQGLKDEYFSVKKHALASCEEELEALRVKLEHRPAPEKSVVYHPSTPSERQKWLDDALAEADRQASRLDASSSASPERFWSALPAWILGGFGVAALAAALVYRWSTRQ